MSFQRYVDWAIDVPMYFIKRGEIYHNVAGVPFRALFEGAVPQMPGVRASLADWSNHLGTLFPEVRLKQFIEMRGADAGPLSHMKALPALWAGLLYHEASRDAAFDLVKSWPANDVLELYQQAPRTGFSTRIGGRAVLDVARDVVLLAEQGLEARNHKNRGDKSESVYLHALKGYIACGKTFADELLEKFASKWRGKIEPVFMDCAI
jgi:glutamate--cysteine ligase